MQRERAPVAHERAAAALAARQSGVITRRQLLAIGLSNGAIEHRLVTRRLHRLHRGVYAFGHPVLRREGRWLAAVLACGPGAVLSHRSAAALWDLRAASRASVDVTSRARTGRANRPGIDVHLPRCLGPDDVTEERGIPVTTPSRTLADLAGVVDARALHRAVRSAERLRVLDVAAIDPHLRPGRRGAAVLRRLLAEYREDVLTRSELEERFLELVQQAGIPLPRCNVHLQGHEVDFFWPHDRLVVETDGYATHATRDQFEADRARDADLLRAGYRVLRLSHRQVTREPQTVVRTLRAGCCRACASGPARAW